MASITSEQNLVLQAARGDAAALERLLFQSHDRLLARIDRNLPVEMRDGLSAEDVLQEVFVVAFRDLRRFQPEGEDSFYRWLSTIARHRLLDAIKRHRRVRRGGGRPRAAGRACDDASMYNLLELAQGNEPTPSRSAAVREAASLVRVALAGLKEEYRVVLRLRYVEGLPVAATAERMRRTDAAVHKLAARAMERLRQALGRSTRFFSSR